MTINPITTAGTPNVVNTAPAAGSAGAPAAAATTAANAAAAADIANAANTMAVITTINGTEQTAAAPKSEAVQTGQPADAAQVQQGGTSKEVNSSKAFSVALEGNISSEITELARTIASRTALMKSLPPEIRELVRQVLNQNQSAQTALTEGLVALLKSPRTVSENLTMLVDLMETAAGLSNQEAQLVQLPARTAAGKQLLSESAAVWQGETPEDLTAVAKVLKELAASLPAGDKLQKPQDTAANLPRANTTGNTQPDMPAGATALPQANQTPETTAAVKIMQAAVAEQADQMLSGTTGTPADAAQTAAGKQQNVTANPAATTNNAAVTQRLAQSLQNLPPEMQEFVLNLLEQDDATMPTAQTLKNLQQTAANLQASQNQQANNPANQTQAATQAPIVVQTPAATTNPSGVVQQTAVTGKSVSVTGVLQNGQQLPQVSAALAELVSSLNKSRKSPLEKITEFAKFMDQAADMLAAQQPKNTQAAVLRQQALAEMAEMLQEKSPEELKAAIKVVQELADTIGKPSGVTAERQEAQKVLTMAMPLYFGDGQTAYPAYIHIYYQEQEDKKNPGQKVTETWLRICLETENIGVVDVAFRLYDENNLDVKVRFTEEDAAVGFTRGIEEVKEQLKQLPLTLGDILVK